MKISAAIMASIMMVGLASAQQTTAPVVISPAKIVQDNLDSHFAVSQSIKKEVSFTCNGGKGSYSIDQEFDNDSGYYTLKVSRVTLDSVEVTSASLARINAELVGRTLIKGDFTKCNRLGVLIQLNINRLTSHGAPTTSQSATVNLEFAKGQLVGVTSENESCSKR
ncbi:hypothetical protein [Dyella tabacisoli]|uniref:Adhesin n=1 Tax=Dyella tabacisoli TaxID=2282381 RepID=A0A369US29_9GAMM|nr:hypothetical protein [Dyella tabacisoli]RDD83562.1 hypothetical protein DVJ77_03015 [Dyella tabacisoli]